MKEAFISYGYDAEEDAYIISHLWVPASERGQGKGRKLLQEAIAEMKAERKADTIKLSADSDHEDPSDPIPAQALVDFYESEGFDLEYAGEIIIMSMSI